MSKKKPKVISLEEWNAKRREKLRKEFRALSDNLVDKKEINDQPT